jgi:hypothetical protein
MCVQAFVSVLNNNGIEYTEHEKKGRFGSLKEAATVAELGLNVVLLASSNSDPRRHSQ